MKYNYTIKTVKKKCKSLNIPSVRKMGNSKNSDKVLVDSKLI